MKVGFVTLLGRPNVGKSTLLNNIIKLPLSPVSSHPQTTRNRITGIYTSDKGQIVFLDTPGITTVKKPLNKILNASALGSLQLGDIIVYIVDVKKFFIDNELIDLLRKSNRDIIILLNKVDLIDKEKLLPIIKQLNDLNLFKEIIPISALKGKNVNTFLDIIFDYLPEGELLYPPEYISGNPEKFIIAEIVKGAIFNKTKDELPYSSAVYVEHMEEDDRIIKIFATIYVERDSQKPIIIGKKGQKIKEIGIKARESLEIIFEKKVALKLFVKVKKHWQKDKQFLRMLGYME